MTRTSPAAGRGAQTTAGGAPPNRSAADPGTGASAAAVEGTPPAAGGTQTARAAGPPVGRGKAASAGRGKAAGASPSGRRAAKSVVVRGPAPRQDRSARTRAQVLVAAAELFARHGFRGTNVQDVADRVVMTKGAVYYFFPNKDSLAVGVVEEHYARWPAGLDDVREAGLSPLATLEEMFNRAACAFRDDPVIQGGARLQIERDYIDAVLPEPYVGWMARVAALLRETREAGELRAGVDPDAAARHLVAAFFGVQHVSEVLHRRADLVERWAEMRELTFYALRA